ncbi:hypothetical protein [Herbaspirillum frisingense]|uniref:G:T/U-mismatch repair DNA glycosylase n=1 Tax=Herbaspirillum frisingense TaxID=92645 RepID=A0ABU1PGY6_9BURK|nr:hypothetical protein [Herbaspirillum frisingense]MDR6585166.1 G:T/U-mismatch repair DNA glycosylase [Herbaspirillum frisingense]
MATSTQQTQADYEERLQEQIGFLKSSAAAYDSGNKGEARRIAAAVRTLVHDTSKSHALLFLLNRISSMQFFDTAYAITPENQNSHSGLVNIVIGKEVRYTVDLLADLTLSN